MAKPVPIAGAMFALLMSGSIRAAAQETGVLLKGKAAFGAWQQDKPGVRRLLTAQDLPPIGKSIPNFAEVVSMPAGAKPNVPAGFSVEMVTSGLAGPRVIRVAPNGDLFIADSTSNTVRVLRVAAGSARPTKSEVFASGLYQPYGIAFYPPGSSPEWVYIANSDSVVRYPYRNGDLTATGKPEKVVERIPWVHHVTSCSRLPVPGQRLRDIARFLEPRAADLLQGRPPAVRQYRQAHRPI
jgi:glucose/arabinose dehydrogenase